jgi:hypothetical protein
MRVGSLAAVCAAALSWSLHARAESEDPASPEREPPFNAPPLPPRALAIDASRPRPRPCTCSLVPHGLYVGLDTGEGFLPAGGSSLSSPTWGFGVHTGYRLGSGLGFDLRLDDLGSSPAQGTSSAAVLRAGGFGVRYTFAGAIAPFAEVHLGLLGPDSSVAGDVALGAAMPIGNHLELNLTARDWIGTAAGALEQVPFVTIGLIVGFDQGRQS